MDDTVKLLMQAAKEAANVEKLVYSTADKLGMTIKIEEEITLRKDGEFVVEFHYWLEMLNYLVVLDKGEYR